MGEYTLQMIGAFEDMDQVASFEAPNIHEAVTWLRNGVFKTHLDHMIVEYVKNDTEANMCISCPFGAKVMYNLGAV